LANASATQATNPEVEDERRRYMQQRGGLDNQMLAKARVTTRPLLGRPCTGLYAFACFDVPLTRLTQANKERLGVLLSEVQNKSGDQERYRCVWAACAA
jgi:hypothetical protein